MTERSELSEDVALLWGKSGDISSGGSGWLPLWRHLADSADVAERLWDVWLPTMVKQRIGRELPAGDADGRSLVRWLAGVHDIGKATPAFAGKVPQLASRMCDHGFTFDAQVKESQQLAPHGAAGYVVLTDWLQRRYGWGRWEAEGLAVVVGGHHGVPPTDADLDIIHSRPFLLGVDGLWPRVRDELLDWMTRRVGVGDVLPRWQKVELSQPMQALLTAVVIVADWIASNEEFFPYGPQAAHVDRVDQAWQALDLPTPWRSVGESPDNAALFAARFTLPVGAQPYPVQMAVADAARRMPLPGLLIIEAPMGEGKTEAALAAVEILASRVGAGGCFIALPTRATSDAMFGRVLAWLGRLPDEDVGRGARGVALVHGKSGLNTEFSALFRHAMPSAIGIDEGGSDIAAHRWLAGRKRSMLSSFAIGTIDQLLFAALKSRHVVLRHLGLAGKVVVIDEAHAYDVYMSRYLDRALHWLGAYGVPVLVLSATLPARRRAEMMQAYDDGRFGMPPRAGRRSAVTPTEDADTYQALRTDLRYPLLSMSGIDRTPVALACAGSGRGASVRLSTHVDDQFALAQTLRGELVDGGCVLVVCNTVARVQHTAEVLRAELGATVPVSVAHSRFMGPDRIAKDRWLRDTFGPPAHPTLGGQARPSCHIVVASQVAEQSLDIDFDLLVSDLAPVDLLLQRIGRLHRHARTGRPARLASPRCLIVGADWESVPPEPVAGSVRVYGRSALLRGAAVLWTHLEQGQPLALPQDIAPLVQAAYGDARVGPEQWQPDLAAAAILADKHENEKRDRAETFRLGQVRAGASLVGWLSGDAGDAESGGDDDRGRAHVRDDGAENLEVLLLVRRDGHLITPPWLESQGGVTVPTDFPPPLELARRIASCGLALPRLMTAGDGIDKIISELEQRNRFRAWQDSPWLGGELILDIDSNGRAEVAGFALEYDRYDGLRIARTA